MMAVTSQKGQTRHIGSNALMFCLPYFLHLLFVDDGDRGGTITLSLWLLALMHVLVTRQPCVQCIIVFAAVVLGLTYSGHYCFVPIL
jgi:hypothetical protein